MSDQKQRTIIVTGGSKGIGRAICMAFADPGARIFFNYASSEAGARETEALVARKGGAAVGIRADVSQEEAVQAFFEKVHAATKDIDVLVNNAGMARDGLLVRTKSEDWDAVLETNLKGAFLCMKLAAKDMIKQRRGRIINIASVVGVTGNAGQSSYVASKSGLIGLTKAAARELAPRNITVNAVAPGYIETQMTADFTDRAKEALINQIPLGRAGKPEDVAATVAFLASEQADYITGQIIHVSGGMFM